MISFLLRGASAGIKLLFVLYLSYQYEPDLLGGYVLLTTVALIFGQILGLEINVITGRNIHKNYGLDKWVHINRQYIIQGLIYLFLFPFIICVSYFFLDMSLLYSLLFCFVVVLDSFFGEVFRTLVSNLKIYYATLLNFFRSAPYILFLMFFSYFLEERIDIEFIVKVWFFSLVLCFICFIIFFKKNFYSLFLVDVQFFLLFKECAPYFLISIFSVIFSQLDKFLISYSVGDGALGYYYVVFSICTVMILFVSFTVGVKNGPEAIKIFSSDGFLKYMEYRPKLFFLYCRAVLVSSIISFFVAILYFFMIKKIDDFFIMLVFNVLANVFLILTDVYKCDLYLYKKDYKIFKNFLFASVFSVFSLYFLSSHYGIVGCSISMFLSSFFLFALMRKSSQIENKKMFSIMK